MRAVVNAEAWHYSAHNFSACAYLLRIDNGTALASSYGLADCESEKAAVCDTTINYRDFACYRGLERVPGTEKCSFCDRSTVTRNSTTTPPTVSSSFASDYFTFSLFVILQTLRT